jgi:hypothetical protein
VKRFHSRRSKSWERQSNTRVASSLNLSVAAEPFSLPAGPRLKIVTVTERGLDTETRPQSSELTDAAIRGGDRFLGVNLQWRPSLL